MSGDMEETWVPFMVRIAVLPEPPGAEVRDFARVESEVRTIAVEEGARVTDIFWSVAFTRTGDMRKSVRAVALVEGRSQYPVQTPGHVSLEKYVHPPTAYVDMPDSLGPEVMIEAIWARLHALGRYFVVDVEQLSRSDQWSSDMDSDSGSLGARCGYWAYVVGSAVEK